MAEQLKQPMNDKELDEILDAMYGLKTKAYKSGATVINLREDGALGRKEAKQQFQSLLKQAELRGRRNGLTALKHYPGNEGTIDIFGLSEREWKQHLIELEAEMENLS